MSDWMNGMTDFQRAEVARLESRIVSFEKRWESLEADWTDCRKELAAMRQERDEAHGLIRNWQTNFIVVIHDCNLAYVPTATYNMTNADKRAFLAATAKEGGGA